MKQQPFIDTLLLHVFVSMNRLIFFNQKNHIILLGSIFIVQYLMLQFPTEPSKGVCICSVVFQSVLDKLQLS
jgi:hypothetical protein